MRKILQGKWKWSIALALSLGVAGCNLFHPTGSRDADNDDADALTRDGYLEYQKSNYDEARKFFSKAIAADSGHSEAWIGLAKAVLKTQDGINAFELASYAQKTEKDGKSSNGFLDMSDAKADTISRGIDSVMFYLDKFIARDTTNRTDKKIRFSNIADSYTILQLTKAALRIRSVNAQLTNIVSADNAGMMVNLNALNDLGDSLKPFLNDMAAAAEAIKASPESAAEIIKAYLPDSSRSYFDEDDYDDVTVGLANSVIQLNERAQTVPEDRNEVFFNFGNGRDDDGDGCVDEEALDNYDNDGDGEIDEDVRDSRSIVLVKKRPQNFEELNAIGQDPTTYDLTKAQLDSLSVLEKYNTIDIDMDGKTTQDDLDEWQFIYRDPNKRDEKKNHLLKFTTSIRFTFADGADDNKFTEERDDSTIEKIDSLIARKELIRKDRDINNIKYDWRQRAQMVGGCWPNYDDEKFLQWFERR
jgi:tetratricopeptide (TPR) repeat protein